MYNSMLDMQAVHVPLFLSEELDRDYLTVQLVMFLHEFRLIPYDAMRPFTGIMELARDFMKSERYPGVLKKITLLTFDDRRVMENFMRNTFVDWKELTREIVTKPETGYSFDQLLMQGQDELVDEIADMPYALDMRIALKKDRADKSRADWGDEQIEQFADHETKVLRLVILVRYFVSQCPTSFEHDPWLFLAPAQWLLNSRRFHPYTKPFAELWITCWLLLRFGFDPYAKGILSLGTFFIQYALEFESWSNIELRMATLHFILVFRTVQWFTIADGEESVGYNLTAKVNALSRCTYLTWFATKDFPVLFHLTHWAINDLQTIYIQDFTRYWSQGKYNFVLLPIKHAGLYGDWSSRPYFQVIMTHRKSADYALFVPKVVALMQWITLSIQTWKGADRQIQDFDTGLKLLFQKDFLDYTANTQRRLDLGLARWYENVLDSLVNERDRKLVFQTVHGKEGPALSYYLQASFRRMLGIWFPSYDPAEFDEQPTIQLVYLDNWIPFAPKLPTHMVFVPARVHMGNNWARFRNFYKQPRIIDDDRSEFKRLWQRHYLSFMMLEDKYTETDLAVTIAYLQSKFYKDEYVAEYMDIGWQLSTFGTDASVQRAFFQPIDKKWQYQQTEKEFAMQIHEERAERKQQRIDEDLDFPSFATFYRSDARRAATSIGIARTLAVFRPGDIDGYATYLPGVRMYLQHSVQQQLLMKDEFLLPSIDVHFMTDMDTTPEINQWFDEEFGPFWKKLFEIHLANIDEEEFDLDKFKMDEDEKARLEALKEARMTHEEWLEYQFQKQLEADYAQARGLMGDVEDREQGRRREWIFKNRNKVFSKLLKLFGHISYTTETYQQQTLFGQLVVGDIVFFKVAADIRPNNIGMLHISFADKGREALDEKLEKWQYVWRKFMWTKFKDYYRHYIYKKDDEVAKQFAYDVWDRINPGWKHSKVHPSTFSYPDPAEQ